MIRMLKIKLISPHNQIKSNQIKQLGKAQLLSMEIVYNGTPGYRAVDGSALTPRGLGLGGGFIPNI